MTAGQKLGCFTLCINGFFVFQKAVIILPIETKSLALENHLPEHKKKN
jgi:hypothetical protein